MRFARSVSSTTRATTRPVDILMIEDRADEVRLVRNMLDSGQLKNRLHVVGSGREAMAYLRGKPPYRDVPKPALVLLGASSPGESGLDVLDGIRNEPALAGLPVVLLTDSQEEDRSVECAQFADYVAVGPVVVDQMRIIIEQIQDEAA